MGKAQSKRSIDITTDPKKVGEGDEGAGKVEKIEDVDQTSTPALNGDAATAKENEATAAGGEKKENEETSENDKDLTTEKKAADAASKGDSDVVGEAVKEGEPAAASGSPKEEEISPLADESIKSKSKKDKVKKKWSFRSISFGKKDKQKPTKTEEPASPTAATASGNAATNGEAERPADAEADSNAAAARKDEQSAEGATGDVVALKEETKLSENGAAANEEEQQKERQEEKQLNGDSNSAAPTVISEEQASPKPDSTNTNGPKAETVEQQNSVAESAAVNSTTEVVTNGHSTEQDIALTNGDKNGLAESPVDSEAAKNLNEESHHQNGTNGVENNETSTPPPTPVAIESEAEPIKNKSQIEVKQELDTTNTVNTITTTTTTTSNENITGTVTENVGETETATATATIAAPELDQTQPTDSQSNTLPNTTNTTNTNSNTNTNDNSTYFPNSQPQDKMRTDAAEEDQVVAAIMAAVSESTDSEGFVVVAASPAAEKSVDPAASECPAEPTIAEAADSSVEAEVAEAQADLEPEKVSIPVAISVAPEPNVEIESEPPQIVAESNPTDEVLVSVAATAEGRNMVGVESSQPPPLPKSPPPSRVSAFALTDNDAGDNADDIKEQSFEHIEQSKAKQEQTNPPAAEQNILLAEIEQQAHAIVDEITTQAADIATDQDNVNSMVVDDEYEELNKSTAKIVTDVDEDDFENIDQDQVKEGKPQSDVTAQAEQIHKEETNEMHSQVEVSCQPTEETDERPVMITDSKDDINIKGDIDEMIETQTVQQMEKLSVQNTCNDNDNGNVISSENSKPKMAAPVEFEDAAHPEDIADLKEMNAAADVTKQDLAVTCE